MSDCYSKLVLTVIAAALVALVVQNAIGPLNAQSGIQRVVVCDPRDPSICAKVAKGPGFPEWGYVAVSQGVK